MHPMLKKAIQKDRSEAKPFIPVMDAHTKSLEE